tara:strand:+ start:13492 stop:14532 length:1041 start_codon:yes stop_codon:yes gene_type:complete
MAVYTVLNKHAIQGILKDYTIGELVKFEPVSSGIENTNYFIWTSGGNTQEHAPVSWVLTVFENLKKDALPFFNQLTGYLQKQGLLVPAPVENNYGSDIFFIQLDGLRKFGVIVPKFTGSALSNPSRLDCLAIGEYVAKMHLALTGFSSEREIDHSPEWCHSLIEQLKPLLSEEDKGLLELSLTRYLDYQESIKQCQAGIVHGDLFRDNVLFEGGKISGVIDFYHAGKTALLFDLAVIANDWAVNFDCLPPLFSEDGQPDLANIELNAIYNEPKLASLIDSYQAVKPLSAEERLVWPRLLELAAFRFWLSRLKTRYLEGYQNDVKEGDVIKSPLAMKLILLAAMQRR